MKVLITGIDGFIGTALAKNLRERGHKVFGLANKGGGVLNIDLVKQLTHSADVVIHLAAITSHDAIVGKKLETLNTNLSGTRNVLEAFVSSKSAKKFLFASSGKVYGKIVHLPITEVHPTDPLNILGKSKLITEKLIDFYSNSKKEFIILRIFNVYGSGQRENFLIPTIFSQLKSSGELVLGDTRAKRDYVYIDDLIDAFVKVVEQKGQKGLSVFNIGTGKSASAKEIVDLIGKIKKLKIKIKSLASKVRHDEYPDEYASYKKAKKVLSWEPKVDLETGLKKMINGKTSALVLAGGEGKRMRKLYPKKPKLLLPVRGKPYLDYLVNYLAKNNCGDIILSTGYLGDVVEKYLKKKKYSLPVSITHEKKYLGTGGAINLSKKAFTEDFFLLFGDVYTEVDLKKMFAFHKKNNALITAVVHKSHHPIDSNLVEFDKKGKVTKILIKPHGRDGKNLYNLAALYILSGNIGKYLPRKTKYDFEKDLLFKLVDENAPIYAYNTSEFIMDFGTPERLKRLEEKLRK